MKNFIEFIPNKVKSIYVLWILLNIFFWFYGGLGGLKYHREFFPYYHWHWVSLREYDLSELLVYTIVPIVLYFAYYLFKKDNLLK